MIKKTLFKQQKVHASLAELWHFFCNPVNLDMLTPEDMKFKILTPSLPDSIHEGLEIAYQVNPILRIPLKWITLISSVTPFQSFKDIQLKGPYALWEHTHVFEEMADGVLVTDHILYSVPGGIVGSIILNPLIERRLEHIFAYRASKISQLFNAPTYAELDS